MNESFAIVGGRSVVRLERWLRHPPEKVWRAITDPAELRHWFPADVAMDVRVGGVVRFVFRNGEGPEMEGRILELDPPHVFAFLWGDSVLRFELRAEVGADGRGCRLLFSHTFDDPVSAASFAAGWTRCFADLDRCLSGAAGPAGPPAEAGSDSWAVLHDRYVKEFGLDRGTVAPAPGGGWVVRFARPLTRPVDEVWQVLSAGRVVSEGGPVPAGFACGMAGAAGLDDLLVTAVDPPRMLSYRVIEHRWPAPGAGYADEGPAGPCGVRWGLAPGNGGARLDLTETVPADRLEERDRALAAWAIALDSLADTLRA